ncbi:MAG: hypothetical protein RLZZ190_619 [Actinomycetota bacterium]
MSTAQYIPGSCNIGTGEIRRRQFVALIGLVLSISSLVILVSTSAPREARLGIFIPLAVASIGWVQSRKKFCLAYGFMGTFNFGKLGQLSKVADSANRTSDRKTALSILFQSGAYAVVATVIIYVIPF